MSNAIANISAALGYDAIESALVSGSLADAMRIAADMVADAMIDADCAPESFAPTMRAEVSTVRPGAKFAA